MLRPKYFVFLVLLTLCYACDNTQSITDEADTSSGAVANGMMEQIDPAVSGVDFLNPITSDFRFNHVSYPYLYNGAGIAVIDYDKDGLQDLFFLRNQESNLLYRNLGNFKFEDVTNSAGLAGPGGFCVGVSVADVNEDGWQDLYISRSGLESSENGLRDRENLLYVNNGDGTFSEEASARGLNSNRPSTQATFFDYDKDGDLDVYLLNTPLDFTSVNTIRAVQTDKGLQRLYGPARPWESDQLFRNDGGKFLDVSETAGVVNRGFGLSTLIIDANNDGWDDIFVANDYVEDDLIYINAKDGTFNNQAQQYLRHTSHSSMGSALGDLNNDARLDIVTLDMLAESPERKKKLENAMRPDRYNTMVRSNYGHQMTRNQLQLNNGMNYSEVGELAGIEATDWSWTPLIVDLNNDKYQDIFISNGYRYELTDLDFISFTVDSIMELGGLSREVFDDYEDFVKLIPSRPQPNYLYLNQGDLKFENVAATAGVGDPSYSGSAVYADLDNDGAVDLIVGNHEEPPFIYRNRNNNGNWLQIEAKGSAKNTAGYGLRVMLKTGQETLVQRMQPVHGFLGSSMPVLHFGLGDVQQVPRIEVVWPDGKIQVIENVPSNQKLVVDYADAVPGKIPVAAAGAMFNYPGGQRGMSFVHRENAFDDFDRQFLQPRMLSREGPALAKGDVNGDGLEDVFLGGAANETSVLFLQNKEGRFVRTEPFAAEDAQFEDVAALFFDVDGDGDLDLYVASGGNAAPKGASVYQDRIYLNEGGVLTKNTAALPPMATPTGAITSIDFDADGDRDLLVGGRGIPGSYPLAPRSYLLENTDGAFQDVTATKFPRFSNIGMVTAIAAGDIMGSKRPAVVIAGEWMPLVTFEWDGTKFTEALDGPKGPAGFWQSLLVEDLDGDGQVEVIAGNDGLNTRFRPGKGARVKLYADDFDGNGAVDPIVTFEDARGKMVPIATKAMMIKQLPSLKKKYVRTAAYAAAAIEDVFSEGQLNGATVLDLETVASVVLRKSGDSWNVEELPRMAQIAPARSIKAKDFNGDGLMDLLMVGNNYGHQVETGRQDAGNGTLLLNDGKGGWQYLANHQHKFWASLDARGLEQVKLADGKTGWVIVNNNGPAAIYVQ